MHTSSRSLRAIQNTLAGPFSSANSSSSSSSAQSLSPTPHSNLLANLGGFMHKQPPRRGSPIATTHHKQAPHDEGSKRSHRASIRLPYASRRLPPPPLTKAPEPPFSEDPFSDSPSFDPTRTVIYSSHPAPRSRRGSSTSSNAASLPLCDMDTDVPTQVALAPDHEARSKLVAGILLHRVHAVGKPMRKIPTIREGPKEYVRSGLSFTVTSDGISSLH